MLIEERNKAIVEYINLEMEHLIRKYNINFDNEQIKNTINYYVNKTDDFETIKKEIDEQIKKIELNYQNHINEIQKLKSQIKPIDKDNPYFGEVYKSYVIHILKLYAEINKSNIARKDKRKIFEFQMNQYLFEKNIEINQYLLQQITDIKKLKIGQSEMFLGSESLDFDTVNNLYKTFINDVNIVSNDYEGKMYCTVINNQQIFDENGHVNKNIKYNFDMLKEIYDFAKSNGKQIKFHTFLWHNAVPENLKIEIDKVAEPVKKRNMTLEFLNDYASKLAIFLKDNEFSLRQIEALNEIANDELKGSVVRESWWNQVLGNNPDNNDEYYIDILKILKKQFPNTEIIYNEYNEFLTYKTDRICQIIENIKMVEQRDQTTYLDGIGLQGHYTDYIREQNRPLTQKVIIESALKLQKACGTKKIYITEYDFLDFQKNGNKQKIEQTILDTYSKIANGFITWGNSDALSWHHCFHPETGENMNAHLIYSNGEPKEMWSKFKDKFTNKEIK